MPNAVLLGMPSRRHSSPSVRPSASAANCWRTCMARATDGTRYERRPSVDVALVESGRGVSPCCAASARVGRTGSGDDVEALPLDLLTQGFHLRPAHLVLGAGRPRHALLLGVEGDVDLVV